MIEEKHAILIPDRVYHVYNRAHGDELMFRQVRNYNYFLTQYRKRISPYVHTLAYCLLPNHFHLLIKVKGQEEIEFHRDKEVEDVHEFISLQFRNFFVSYTKSYNLIFKRKGGLFMHRFKRKEVSGDLHLITVLSYIHNNPLNHGLVKEIHDHRFSSFHDYESDGSTWINRALIESKFAPEIIRQMQGTK
jgi:putative transposase